MPSEARISAQSGTPYNGDTNTKYKLDNYTYPSDLFDNKAPYNNNWVMININILEQSKYLVKADTYDLVPSDRKTNDATNRNQTTAEAVGSAALGGGILAAAGSIVNNIRNTVTDRVEALANTTTAAVQGAVVGAAVVGVPLALAGSAAKPVKQLKAAIQLPMPNAMVTPYSTNWSPSSTDKFDMMMRVPGIGARAIGDIMTGNVQNLIKEGGGAADAIANLALSLPGSEGVSAASGLAANPKNEMIFQGVDFRNFQLDYTFYPKNEGESMNIKRIIDLLKFHMFPEYKSAERFTFVYPSEFDITFYVGDGKENPWVNRVATSVLTNMNVNYTPAGQWAAHADGSPVMINLSLQFKELSILTKENLVNPSDADAALKANF